MATPSSRRKQPVSHKRVALVLASLVGMMTLGAASLLALEGGAPGTSVPGMAVDAPSFSSQIEPTNSLQTKAWNYIILYESADVSASAATLADGLSGGPNSPHVRPKANFHFVIDGPLSGDGTLDGKLEISTGWQNQNLGAPYAAWPDTRSYSITPYNNAIGICLISDMNRRQVTQGQYQKLIQLVHELQKRWQIPSQNVLFQWNPQLNALRPSPSQDAFERGFRADLR